MYRVPSSGGIGLGLPKLPFKILGVCGVSDSKHSDGRTGGAVGAGGVRGRFGASRFADLGLPGGALVDEGLADLACGRTSVASLLVSLAAPRLRREGVPVTNTQPDPEFRLYRLLSSTEGDLAYARYNAYLRLIVSFADSCSAVRLAEPEQRASDSHSNAGGGQR